MTACLHPGGLALTEKLLQMAALPTGARILDLGCGKGTTVSYLQQAGYDAFGIDLLLAAHSCIITGEMRRPLVLDRESDAKRKPDPEPGKTGDGDPERANSRLIQGDMRSLPFESERFDAVLAECSLLSCGDRDAALAESLRVLRPGGAILASDLFFPETDGKKAERCAEAFARAGFSVLGLEDASPHVQAYFLQFIWEHGCLPEAWKKLTAGRKKVGYYLIHGRK